MTGLISIEGRQASRADKSPLRFTRANLVELLEEAGLERARGR